MKKILEGIKVVDWSQWHAGPQAAALLGDLGADVYHLEHKGVGDQYRGMISVGGIPANLPQGPHLLFEGVNRNKRGLALDLSKPSGKEILNRLVKTSDVFLTNIETDTMSRFGLDYPTLCEINPQLIYAWSTPYGDRGPDADMPGFDPLFQSRGGVMACIGPDDDPCMGPAFIADEMAGVMLAYAVLGALLARERHGIGQEVRCSGMASAMQLVYQHLNVYLLSGREIPKNSRQKPNIATFNYYKCKDGAWITVAAHRDMDWAPLCRALGMPELATDAEYDTMMKRLPKAVELTKILDEAFAKKTRPEWIERLKNEHIPHAPVNTISDMVLDPQVLDNDYIIDYHHPLLGDIKVFGFPWQFSRTPAERTRPAPEVGQHNEEILTEICGYTWDDIGRFQEEGVI